MNAETRNLFAIPLDEFRAAWVHSHALFLIFRLCVAIQRRRTRHASGSSCGNLLFTSRGTHLELFWGYVERFSRNLWRKGNGELVNGWEREMEREKQTPTFLAMLSDFGLIDGAKVQ